MLLFAARACNRGRVHLHSSFLSAVITAGAPTIVWTGASGLATFLLVNGSPFNLKIVETLICEYYYYLLQNSVDVANDS